MSNLLRRARFVWSNRLLRTLLMLIMLVMSVFIFHRILTIILKTEYPLSTPESWSMWPTISRGDLLVIQGGLRGEDIRADPKDGDIIVFKDPRGGSIPIVHRAIYKKYDESRGMWFFKTKGDNVAHEDFWIVWEDSIYGKVILIIPYLGYIRIYLGNERGIAIITILIIALLVSENWDLIKGKLGSRGGEPNNDQKTS
ncbi:MAG: signal peptidase I [Candidatus Bathyarchaeota archaeon]|nr:signal peptidase I [Candidatus Bathyarchaeota archaeon]